MAKRIVNNIKLGVFVVAGLLLLVFSLYIIGQNQNFWGSHFMLKARMQNVDGLMQGNNVRFSGIQCGTVKSIEIINDTTIEVAMLIKDETSRYIRESAVVSIGNEGLMGNKVVNILPTARPAPPVKNGGILQAVESKALNEMLGTLSVTNENAAVISEELKQLIVKLNRNAVLWKVLEDSTLPDNIHYSLQNIRNASEKIDGAAHTINAIVKDVRKGGNVAGILLSDKEAAKKLNDALSNLHSVSAEADSLVAGMNDIVQKLDEDINTNGSILNTILTDTALSYKLNNSMNNIEKGTAAFNEDMEALKHNFPLRGYFRKQEKKNRKR